MGAIGERLNDFVYQVEEFAAFHAWDAIETCRQARTHLKGGCVGLHMQRTPTSVKLARTERFADMKFPTKMI